MNAPNEDVPGWRLAFHYAPCSSTSKCVRELWLTPPRSGISRFIAPWAYRHLRFFGVAHIAGGSVAAAAALICLVYGAYGWAAFFLIIAVLHLAGGTWYLTIDRSGAARA